MRILHVLTLVDYRTSYAGPLTVAINQCRELRRRRHDAQILAGWRGTGDVPTELEGVPAHLFPVHKVIPGTRFSTLYSRKMSAWLRKEGPTFDVAHLHLARDLVPLMAGVRLRQAGVPYVSQTHGMVLPDDRVTAHLLDRMLTFRVLENATTRFVLTGAEDSAIVKLLSHDVSTEQMPNGIGPDLGDLLGAEPLDSRGELDVLFMSALHPRKHVMDFALAALTLIREGARARFTVIGPDDGDLPALQRFMTDRAIVLDGKLTYGGTLSHELSLARLRRADIFVLPSTDDPFPMTLLEALAAGTASICTTGCGVSAELEADNAAVVIEPGAPALANALRALLNSPEERARLAAAGPRSAKAHFSIANVARQLLHAYRQEQEALT